MYFDKDFNDFRGGLGMPFGSQNRFQIRQNPSSEIINFLTLILHAFLVPSGSNNDVFASGCLCGLDICHSFELCSAFRLKKLPKSMPKDSQFGAPRGVGTPIFHVLYLVQFFYRFEVPKTPPNSQAGPGIPKAQLSGS